MKPLNISVSRILNSSATRLVVLRGSADAHATPVLHETFDRLRGEGVTGFIVDMEEVDFLNSTAMGVLVSLADDLE
ncbi:MAG: STAS domain-containing protein, partial [Planctomycetes bacterium]|nr:STAS domain-containing protein [Planctomycetota bacterium]